MSKVVSAVSAVAEQKVARKALHAVADSVNKSSSKFRDAGVALNAYAIALGEKSPWFLTTAHNLSEPLRTEYDTFMSELQVGEASKPMYWLRVKEYAAAAAHEELEKNPAHPWAPHFQKMREVKEKAEQKLAAERARKEKAKQDTATLKAQAAKQGAVKPLAAELAHDGPVSTDTAEKAVSTAVEKLPAQDRLVLEFADRIAQALALLKGVPVADIPPELIQAGTDIGRAFKAMAPRVEKARANLNKVVTK